MQPQLVPGYEGGIALGQRRAYTFNAVGPAAYNATTGDILSLPVGTYLDAVMSCMSVSKTYYVRFYPSVTHTTRATWVAKWYVISTGAEAGSIDLSGEKVQFAALGGEF